MPSRGPDWLAVGSQRRWLCTFSHLDDESKRHRSRFGHESGSSRPILDSRASTLGLGQKPFRSEGTAPRTVVSARDPRWATAPILVSVTQGPGRRSPKPARRLALERARLEGSVSLIKGSGYLPGIRNLRIINLERVKATTLLASRGKEGFGREMRQDDLHDQSQPRIILRADVTTSTTNSCSLDPKGCHDVPDVF